MYSEEMETISVEKRYIPAGAELMECYRHKGRIIVCGEPEEDDPNHNCDAMGCTTASHVLYRFKVEEGTRNE